jgi:hypothetical protein
MTALLKLRKFICYFREENKILTGKLFALTNFQYNENLVRSNDKYEIKTIKRQQLMNRIYFFSKVNGVI